ncbi:MAG: hypothetical protein WD355_07295, partial [Balneolaceae bacterium]
MSPVHYLFLIFFLVGCTTAEQAVVDSQASPEPELTESSLPDWFMEDRQGELIDGKLYGYAAVPGIDSDSAIRLARQQAVSHLRFWVDRMLEESRELASMEDPAANSPEFIRDLRNAVRTMEFS